MKIVCARETTEIAELEIEIARIVIDRVHCEIMRTDCERRTNGIEGRRIRNERRDTCAIVERMTDTWRKRITIKTGG